MTNFPAKPRSSSILSPLLGTALLGGSIAIAAGADPGPITWTRTSVPLPESIWSVEAVDTNADGKLDLIAMGETKVFALVAPDWKPQVLFD